MAMSHVEVVRLLVDHGADLTIQDKQGIVPLHVASQGGRVEVTHFLTGHGEVSRT